MTYRKIILIFSLLTGFGAAAQEGEKLETDRPGESQSAQTVDRGTLQAELGLRREREDPETVDYYEPRTILRYGLLKGFELRAEISPVTERQSGKTQTGLLPVEFGLKAGLWEGKGIVPQAALYGQVGIPKFSSEAFRPTYAEPRVRLLFANEITKQVKLNYNLGAEWTGEDTEPQWIYTFTPNVSISKNWEAFAEVYGFLKRGSLPEHSFDTGLSYYIGRRAKADLSAGVGLTSAAPVNFVTLGFSVQF